MNSNKLKMIDANVYQQMQQSDSNVRMFNKQIRNAKYKRLSTTFNLLQYLVVKYKKNRNFFRKRQLNKFTNSRHIHKGKQREYKRRKESKLKRTILQYRLSKQNQSLASCVIKEENTACVQNNLIDRDKLSNDLVPQSQDIARQIGSLKITNSDYLKSLSSKTEGITISTEVSSKLTTKETYNQNSLPILLVTPIEKTISPSQTTQSKLHSRRFREYCDNLSTPRLRELAEHLLRELNRFQSRSYALNQIKGMSRRRFVVGFHEVQNKLKIKKLSLVIIATDCEKCDGKDGLDDIIFNIKSNCKNQQVPLAFIFERRKLAYILWKKASVSCVGVLNYDGLRDTFNELIFALEDARQAYIQVTRNK